MVGWYVCVSVCFFVGYIPSPVKTAEPIQMPFGQWLTSFGSSDESIRCREEGCQDGDAAICQNSLNSRY